MNTNGVPSPLVGRVAVVTGGASGIGLAIAERLSADGATVVVVDRDPPTDMAADDRYIRADLAQPGECASSIAQARASFGPISILDTGILEDPGRRARRSRPRPYPTGPCSQNRGAIRHVIETAPRG